MDCLVQFSSKIFSSEPNAGKIGSIELNIWIAQLSGIPLIGLKKESMGLKMTLLIYGVLLTTVMAVIYTAFELYELVIYLNDLDAVTQNASLSLTHVAGLAKICNTFYRYKDVRDIIEQLKVATKKYVVSKNQRKAFFRGELENKFSLLGFAIIVGFTGCLSFAMLIYNPENLAYKVFPYRIILPSFLPNSVRLVYMGLSTIMFAIQIVAIDCLNFNLINQIRFQLKVLNISFEDLMINNKSGKPLKVHQLIKVNGRWITPHERLQDIIEHHCLLMRLRADVESIYRYPILLQFFMWLIIFAMTGFQAIVSTDNPLDHAVIYCYCCCILSELFLYCWFGNDVSEQSKTLSTSGYNSTWYQFDENFKKSLLIFLTNAQQPFFFTAGGFIGLSLQSFTGILAKSYTFITVLLQVSGR